MSTKSLSQSSEIAYPKAVVTDVLYLRFVLPIYEPLVITRYDETKTEIFDIFLRSLQTISYFLEKKKKM